MPGWNHHSLSLGFLVTPHHRIMLFYGHNTVRIAEGGKVVDRSVVRKGYEESPFRDALRPE